MHLIISHQEQLPTIETPTTSESGVSGQVTVVASTTHTSAPHPPPSKSLTAHLQDGTIRRHAVTHHGAVITRQQSKDYTTIIYKDILGKHKMGSVSLLPELPDEHRPLARKLEKTLYKLNNAWYHCC